MKLGFWNGIKEQLALGVLAGGVVTYSISGIVYDADGSTAVSGATVALGAYSAVSGGDGSYTITGVPAGTSGSMTCTLAGYVWTSITVSAVSGNLTGQDYTASPYFYDTFTDTDSTVLTAHTADVNLSSNPYSATIDIYNSPTALLITSNQGTKAPNASTQIGGSVVDISQSGQTTPLIIDSDLTTPNSALAGHGLLFRYTDTDNYWYLFFTPGGTPSITLRKHEGGSDSVVDSSNNAVSVTTQYHIKITLNGNSISVEVAGDTLTGSDSFNASATKHGIAVLSPAASNTPGKVDNLWMARVSNP